MRIGTKVRVTHHWVKTKQKKQDMGGGTYVNTVWEHRKLVQPLYGYYIGSSVCHDNKFYRANPAAKDDYEEYHEPEEAVYHNFLRIISHERRTTPRYVKTGDYAVVSEFVATVISDDDNPVVFIAETRRDLYEAIFEDYVEDHWKYCFSSDEYTPDDPEDAVNAYFDAAIGESLFVGQAQGDKTRTTTF